MARLGVMVALLMALTSVAVAQKRPKPTAPKPDKVALRIKALEKELLQHQMQSAMYRALRVARELHALKAKKLGEGHAETLRALESVATYRAATGDYNGALAIYQQLLARAEKAHGPDAPATADAIERVASQYWVAQRFEEAEKLYRRALAIRKKQHGADSPLYAHALMMFGGVLWGRGSFSTAEQVYLEAKKILEKTSKDDDAAMVGLTMNLGWLYWMQGQKALGKTWFEKSLAASEKTYAKAGLDESYAATMILSIASIYSTGGREDWARPLEERSEKVLRAAITRIEKDKGPNAMELMTPISSLIGLHQRRKEYDQAEALMRRMIALDEARAVASKLPVNPMTQVSWLFQLSYLERQRGNPKAALPLLAKVRAVYAKSYGDYMTSMIDQQVADVWRELGKYDTARRMVEKTLRTSRKTWGSRHPMVSYQLESLSVLQLVDGDTRHALGTLREALDIQEPNLALVLATGTESDHATYFARIAHQLSMAVTLNTKYAPKSEPAARLALTTVLRRKGRILDAAASSVATLRGKLGADDQKLLDELAAARAQLAKLIVAGPGATGPDEYAAEVGRLESEVRRLEDQARRRSSTYAAAGQPIELERVQKAIPTGATLVEIVLYQPYDARKWGTQAALAPARRYAAYLLGPKGAPRWVDLGEAAASDRAAYAFLDALADPDRTDVGALGRTLHDAAFQPIASALGKTDHLLMAPDGLLSLVPFGALVDRNDQHLVRRFTFTYLTSGRDLLRAGATGAASRGGPVIVADPTFGNAKAAKKPAATARTRGRRSRDLRSRTWGRLPGTAEEADALAKLLDGATVLRGTKATEDALKHLAGPRILHVATHGFFLPAEAPPPPVAASQFQAGPSMPLPATAALLDQAGAPENPLLRSGLALAGANTLSSGTEDGILTALEAAGLDLAGTRLVVLSACETGVGKVTEGDGVHGLRRALVIAGAETLVMSLWQVDDRATRELMTGYYKKLEAGEGRSAALRAVQLQMLRNERTAHPYYWASFVPTGKWGPIQ